MLIKRNRLRKIIKQFLNEQESEENKTIDSVKLEKKKESNEKKHGEILKIKNPDQSIVQFAAFLQSNLKDEDLKSISYTSPKVLVDLGVEEKEYTYEDFKKFGKKVKISLGKLKSN